MSELHRRRGRDDGSAPVIETVVFMPVLMLVLVAVAGLSILGRARIDADDASAAAARAASLARTVAGATAAAKAEAARDLGAGGRSCGRRDVVVDTAGFRPGGMVKVTVTCHADLSSLPGIDWLPVQTTLTSSSLSPLDVFREITR